MRLNYLQALKEPVAYGREALEEIIKSGLLIFDLMDFSYFLRFFFFSLSFYNVQ